MEAFINHLKTFVYLQVGLWGELIRGLSDQVDSLLLNVPDSGFVELDGIQWKYTKHGLGVLFEEENGKRKVDFHSVKSGDRSFDAWGLSTYFGALGGEGRKVLKSVGIISGPLEDNLRDLLARLEKENVLSANEGFYRFL
jgi:hypothetical protein